MGILVALWTVLVGLIFGSFLTVCIHRIPFGRKKGLESLDESEDDVVADEVQKEEKLTIISPSRSFCPNCKHSLRWYHNIPLLSWLILRGRCEFCKNEISVRYPLVELLSALALVLSVTNFGLTPTAALVYAFVASLIVISFIDYDYYIIPNVISIPGAVIGLLVGVVQEFHPIFAAPVVGSVLGSVIGVAIGGGFLLIVSEFYLRVRKKVGLGLGDVKLLAMTGAFFGGEGAVYTIFVGSLLGAICGLLIMLVQRRGASHPIPFGPYLAGATVLYIFGGPDLLGHIVIFIQRTIFMMRG